jgi:hypothetical protein
VPVKRAALLALSTLIVAPALAAQGVPSDAWEGVSRILQSAAAPAPGYHRFNFPRRDLVVRVGGVTVSPGLALTGWVGFSGAPEDAIAMGDLIVTAAELGPVIRGLLERGIEVTAVHNHLAGESPQLLYVHFHAHGEAAALAGRMDEVLRLTAAPRPVGPAAAVALTIDTAAVFGGLGVRGRANGAVASIAPVLFPAALSLGADTLLRTMAAASPINIQQLDDANAAASGDFAVPADRVQPLLRALTRGGLTPTAVHSHLIGERPTITYVHFWGVAPLAELVRGLRAALDAAR